MSAARDCLPWSRALVGRSAFVATVCLAVGGVVGYALAHEPAPPGSSSHAAPAASDGPEAAGPAELALLAPLRVGDSLDGCVVARIDAVHDGRLVVHCSLGAAPVQLYVTRASPDAPPAPATSGRYAVYYSASGPASADGARLASSLARVLDAHASEPGPDGLRGFSPR